LAIHAALAIVAADFVQTLGEAELHQLTQRHRSTGWPALRQHHGQGTQHIEIAALFTRQAHNDIEAPITFKDLACRLRPASAVATVSATSLTVSP
jgi:hypothetical protein